MDSIGVILARSGSEGVANKNGREVAGQPMLAWTIEHALRSQWLGTVVLSSDSEAYGQIARGYTVGFVHRPEELASSTATVDAAARHAVQRVEEERGVRFDPVVLLYGNVPVRPVDLSDRAVAKLMESGCDSVQSVCAVGKMHPYWMKTLGGEAGDELGPYEPNTVYRRQDLPPVYALDGGVIAVRRASLFTVREGEPHAFLGQDRRAVVTRPGEVLDVDDELDLRVAEAVLGQGSELKVQG